MSELGAVTVKGLAGVRGAWRSGTSCELALLLRRRVTVSPFSGTAATNSSCPRFSRFRLPRSVSGLVVKGPISGGRSFFIQYILVTSPLHFWQSRGGRRCRTRRRRHSTPLPFHFVAVVGTTISPYMRSSASSSSKRCNVRGIAKTRMEVGELVFAILIVSIVIDSRNTAYARLADESPQMCQSMRRLRQFS